MKSQTIPNVKSVEMKKTLFIKKVPISSNSTFKDDFKLLFENPSTYLRLPGESPKHYIVGKKPTGPRYDEDEKVIPHSIVGTPRMFKRKGQGNNNSNASRINTFHNPPKRQTSRNVTMANEIISDRHLESLYNKCRNKISDNATKKNHFLQTIPDRMEDKVIKELKSQETCLEKHKIHEEYRKTISNTIRKKLFNSSYYKLCSDLNNNSTLKATKLKKKKELLMDQVDMYRMKKSTKDYSHTITNDIDPEKRYGRYSWIIGLRRKKNSNGIRKNFINIGSSEKPVWCTVREHLPIINETVVLPGENSGDKMFMQSSSVEPFVKTSPTLSGYLSKTMNLLDLEISGKDLLEFEEENSKVMRGRKKLVPIKYENDCLKDLEIAENWK